MPNANYATRSISPSLRKKILREHLESGCPNSGKGRVSSGIPDESYDDSFFESSGDVSFDASPYINTGNPQTQISELDRGSRWYSFLYHSNFFYVDLIRRVYGANITADASEWRTARTKLMENTKAFKARVLAAISAHIDNIYREESTSHLRQIKERRELHAFFQNHYTISNFNFCWGYMNNYLDVEKSKDLGKYYCKSIYTNLCTEVKLWKDADGTMAQNTLRKELLIFYNELPVSPDYDDVSEHEFYHITDRGRKERQKSTRDPGNKILGERYGSIGAPPPRCNHNTPRQSSLDQIESSSQ